MVSSDTGRRSDPQKALCLYRKLHRSLTVNFLRLRAKNIMRKVTETFDRFISHNIDPQGVEPKFTDVRPMKSIGFPMITIATAQELRDSIDLKESEKWIDRSIKQIRRDHLKPELRCVLENVGKDGEIIDHFDGRMLNPGHAIEASWFIMQEGKLRNDPNLIKTGCQILDWSWEKDG